MSILDFIIVAIAVISFLWGIRKGFVGQLMSLIGLIFGLWGASKLTVPITTKIMPLLGPSVPEGTVRIIVYIILAVLFIILFNWLGRLLEKVMNLTILGGLNKVLGAVFSLLKAVVVAMIIASIIDQSPESLGLSKCAFIKESKIYPILVHQAELFFPFIKSLFACVV